MQTGHGCVGLFDLGHTKWHRAALAKSRVKTRFAKGPQTTKELALASPIAAKGLYLANALVAKATGNRHSHSLRMQGQRGPP